MNAIWRTIRGYILWQYERGTLHYDIMVTLIISFVLFSPRVINFNDKPIARNPHPTEVVVSADAEGHLFYQVAASAVSPGDDQAVRDQLLRIIEPISGAVSIVSYETISDGKGQSAELQSAGQAGLAAVLTGIDIRQVCMKVSRSSCRRVASEYSRLQCRSAGEARRLDELETVLKKMDAAAANFRTTQAEFEWDTYEKVIDEVDDVQTGTIYYRRTGKEIEMMADVKNGGHQPRDAEARAEVCALQPRAKFACISPRRTRSRCTTWARIASDFESYVVLGFGGSGQDLVKVVRRDLRWPGDDQRRGHGEAATRPQIGEGAQLLTTRFFCGSISTKGSRCSSSFLRRRGITAWPSTPRFS